MVSWSMENIISKINKMLELARRGGTEAEGRTAQKMADELLSKYSLLIANIEGKTNPEDYMFEGTMTNTLRATWQDSIYVAISKLYLCTYFKSYKSDKTSIRSIVGETANVEVAKKVAAHLVLIALTLAKETSKGSNKIRSFKKGFACRIWARVEEQLKEENRESLVNSIPEMKKSAQAQQEQTDRQDNEPSKAKNDDMDRLSFEKGFNAANLVPLTLHEFLR